MFEDSTLLVIMVSVLVALSYVYSAIAGRTKIPSVILLIFTGIAFRFFYNRYETGIPDTGTILRILGLVGVILIVLEASMELRLERKKIRIALRALLSALVILLVSSFLIAYGIRVVFPQLDYQSCLVNAIPLAVISSAVAIPSVSHMREEKREFIIYESIFSDILGILFFNAVITYESVDFSTFSWMLADFAIVLTVSVMFSALVLVFINKTTMNIKFFLMIALLVLLYSLGELFHLSSLLMILVFGVALNNLDLIGKGRMAKYIESERVKASIANFKLITGESAFLIRTFFFFIFGFTLHLALIMDFYILITGLLIVILLYGIRFLYLKFIARSNLFPEIFVAPRGLITILLFYSIPEQFNIGVISEGVLFFVIIVSALFMTAGLFRTQEKIPEMEIYIGLKKKWIRNEKGFVEVDEE